MLQGEPGLAQVDALFGAQAATDARLARTTVAGASYLPLATWLAADGQPLANRMRSHCVDGDGEVVDAQTEPAMHAAVSGTQGDAGLRRARGAP